jgi:LemA protein
VPHGSAQVANLENNSMPILYLILIFALGVLGYIFYAYNRLAQLANTSETEWAQIEVLLKKRADLIPNIVEVVRGYAKHEKEVLEKVSRARAEAMVGRSEKSDSETSLSSHVKSVLAMRESYPDLKANADFLALQKELFSIEDEIAERRTNYNSIVKAHNDFVLKFPGNVVAGATGFPLLPLFEFTGSREAPRLNLSPEEDKVV